MGSLEGVVATKPGWIGKTEVVEVTYDPTVLPYEVLAKEAATRAKAHPVHSDTPVRVEGDKYYVSRTALRFLPLTPRQATLVHGRLGRKQPPRDLLSPAQRRLLARIVAAPEAAWPLAIGKSFEEAWAAAQRVTIGLEAKGD